MEKKKVFPGADEKSPSRAQYFSWINNTNEGSTESQTLANLRYFEWLRNTYGMQLDIYAWDAGNLDGAGGTYEGAESAKNKAQFPNGYGPIAKKAAEGGVRLGVWCGPDGFGNTAESEKARYDLMVSLCRDYHFELFKIDGVCGQLRVKKRKVFCDMMTECRRFSPDLILLNHRLPLGRGAQHATTFLWNGVETYVDVHIANHCTAPNHRAFLFNRGHVPGLKRLSEDHGVCLSSCMDGFEDDLIYQAFGRCLILSPEIYANPWLLRDDEQAHLARIYTLHRRWRDILVNGKLLDDAYGCNAVSRGDGSRRFITTGSDCWEGKDISLKLNSTLGLRKCEKVAVQLHHPYEQTVGTFGWGETVTLHLPAFRAVLIEVCNAAVAEDSPEGCCYEVITAKADGTPETVKVLSSTGKASFRGKALDLPAFDERAPEPLHLGTAKEIPLPANGEQLFELANFSVDSDSLEYRSLVRAGETAVPEVKAARDAFFAQRIYGLRGCEAAAMFDGNPDTFFDAHSKLAFGGMRIRGGCLRVDFGAAYEADYVTMDFFNPAESHREMERQTANPFLSYSTDLADWKTANRKKTEVLNAKQMYPLIVNRVHNIVDIPGKRMRAIYPVEGTIRYFRMPKPVDRIYKVALWKDGKELTLEAPRANNLLPLPSKKAVKKAKTLTVTVTKEQAAKGVFLAVALDGTHGVEGAYPVALCRGEYLTFPDRAPSYPSNAWECPVRQVNSHYTYYLPVTEQMAGEPIQITLLQTDKAEYPVQVYLCGDYGPRAGKTVTLK